MLNVGIVGFGKMGLLHGALLNASKKAKLVAICDKSNFMRFMFKKVYKDVNCYSNIDKMLKENTIDVLLICTPTFNHIDSAIKGIENGCDIFIEKPLVTNVEDALKIKEVADRYNSKVQVGFCNRYAPSIKLGKEYLNQSKIGNILNAKSYMFIADVFDEHSGWRYDKNMSGGGVLIDFGIHMLDQMYWFFGDIQSVSSVGKKIYSKEVEDEMVSNIKFKNGISVYFETSWSKSQYRKSFAKIEIYGDLGTMIVTDQTLELLDLDGNRLEYYTYPQIYGGSFVDIGGISYSNQIDEFLNYVTNGIRPLNTLENSVYLQKVIEKMYESSNNNGLTMEV